MERPISIALSDETKPVLDGDLPTEDRAVAGTGAADMTRVQELVPLPGQRLRGPEDGSLSDEHPMRLRSFDESCPHVRDQIIPMNGGRFNVDHYLRVLRAKAETDVSVAMALTAVGQQKTATALPHHLALVGGTPTP